MTSFFKRMNRRHKNNKLFYYTKALTRELLPASLFRAKLNKKFEKLAGFDVAYLKYRVNYYNKLSTSTKLHDGAICLSQLKIPKTQKAYYFDTHEFTRYFDGHLKAQFMFGDVTTVPEGPSIVKSRPICEDNSNSVVLKLDKIRHFIYIDDKKDFLKKKNMLVGRGVVIPEHRIRFFEMYFNHPMCDLGQINQDRNRHWIKDRLTIDEHLDFKFILCIEGNDVASNLKWVMSSNSLAVMPKPRFETWYMEGTLRPNYHYVEIRDDYADLEERLLYYIENPDEALQIIKNANEYTKQFRDKEREDIISLLVLEKYFYLTGQREPMDTFMYNQT